MIFQARYIEEVIVDASAVKGQTQPILVHSKMRINLNLAKHQRLNILYKR